MMNNRLLTIRTRDSSGDVYILLKFFFHPLFLSCDFLRKMQLFDKVHARTVCLRQLFCMMKNCIWLITYFVIYNESSCYHNNFLLIYFFLTTHQKLLAYANSHLFSGLEIKLHISYTWTRLRRHRLILLMVQHSTSRQLRQWDSGSLLNLESNNQYIGAAPLYIEQGNERKQDTKVATKT